MPGQQPLHGATELGPIERVRERKLDKALEVAGEVADVVAPLFGLQLDSHDTSTLVTEGLDGVGKLDFTALIWTNMADFLKDDRRENIPPGDSEVAGRVPRIGFFDYVGNSKDRIGSRFGLNNAVTARRPWGHFLYGDYTTEMWQRFAGKWARFAYRELEASCTGAASMWLSFYNGATGSKDALYGTAADPQSPRYIRFAVTVRE